MEHPNIKIRINGYTACTLLGKAKITASFMRRNRHFYTVEAITPVEPRLQSLEMNHIHIKVLSILNERGYLVYFATGISGWFELMPLTDERFNKYEDELMEGI